MQDHVRLLEIICIRQELSMDEHKNGQNYKARHPSHQIKRWVPFFQVTLDMFVARNCLVVFMILLDMLLHCI